MPVVWSGLRELMEEIRTLPETLTGEAAHLVDGAANAAKVDIAAAYPWRTGDLRKKTTVVPLAKKGLIVGAVVKNTSKLATIFENGTQARHTELGAARGSMPPGHVFVPRIVKARRALLQQLKAMVTRHGAVVSGDA